VGGNLQHVAWESCLVEPVRDRALERYALRRQGIPNPAIRYFTPVPWLARALLDLHPEYGFLMHLAQPVADLVALVVCQENSCRFCYAAVRAMLWSYGMSLDRIHRVEHDLTRAGLPSRTAAAMAFGRSQSRSGPPAARAARDALQSAGVTVDEMKEIAFAVAFVDFSNRAHTIPAIPVLRLERLPERLPMRLLRPVLARLLRSRHARGRPTPLGPVPPYAYGDLLRAYEGSPIGAALGRTLEGMWASPHLTRRCKLLMLAVITRGLGCPVCSHQITDALQAEGLPPASVTQALTHLDAPELDPVERLLVPFARDTIWYEPAPLQRRTRTLSQQLSGAQLLEAIGVAALANGLCRMAGMVLDRP